jgi:hypothetical protein
MPDFSRRLAAPILGLTIVLVAEYSASAADGAPTGAASPATDKSGYTLFNPTPDALMRAFEPERPAKASNPFTVDAGHFQIETDLFNYIHTNYLGAVTQFYETADPTLKLGVTNWMDVEIIFNGYQNSVTHSNLTGSLISNGHGFGDTFFRVKVNAFGNDGGAVALGFIPYVKAPSAAPGLGNGVVEGGLIAPFQINLPQDFSLVLQTEFDALKNANDSRRHANFVNLASLSHPLSFISKDLSLTVEFYSAVGTDSATPAVYTFDAGLAYLITPNLQLDAGANFGLTKASPDLNVYTGVSARF